MDPQTEVEQGILAIKGVLKYDASKPIDGLNTPRIVIHPKCTNLISAIERWSRDPKSGKPKDDCYKDPLDCLRYDVMSAPVADGGNPWPDVQRPSYKVET